MVARWFSNGIVFKPSAWKILNSVRWWGFLIYPVIIMIIYLMIALNEHPNVAGKDAVFFELVGRHWILTGEGPYRYIWDIKPPLIHETAAVLSILTGGTPRLMHVVGMALSVGAAVGAISIATLFVYEVSNDRLAAFVTGGYLVAIPAVYDLALVGLRPKPLYLLFAIATLYAGMRRRYIAAGAFATISAWYYQLGFILVSAVLLTVIVKPGNLRFRTQKWTIGVITGISTVVLLPILVEGALMHMITQVFGAAFVTAQSSQLSDVIPVFHIPVVILSTVGLIVFVLREQSAASVWLVVFGGSLLLLGTAPLGVDRFDLALIAAIGIGFAIAYSRPERDRWTLTDPRLHMILMIGMIVLLDGGRFSHLVGMEPYQHHQQMFFDGELPDKCHIRMSGKEQKWINRMPVTKAARECWTPASWYRLIEWILM